MALIDWKDEYGVGIPSLDGQHRRLIDLINSLHAAMLAGKANEALEAILDELLAYTRSHFGAEERLLAQHAYPGYLQQKREHEHLVGQLLRYQQQARDGRAFLSSALLTFLREWLVKHICGMDRAYGPFLQSKGVA